MKKIVNAIGMSCPQPVVLTKNALENLDKYNIVEVYVDNDIAVQNVMKFVRSKNLEVSYSQINDKEFHIKILVSENSSAEKIQEISNSEEMLNSIVIISSETMGEGDPKLGSILIKGFLYALTQQERLPQTIIMYNGGAKLAIKESICLEDLKTLEQLNVEILTCGTCLKHYNLEDKLAVGNTTNMYTIAEKMIKANTIIKP